MVVRIYKEFLKGNDIEILGTQNVISISFHKYSNRFSESTQNYLMQSWGKKIIAPLSV